MINIAIIDQNKTYRESLRTLLNQVDGFRVVQDSSSADSEWTFYGIPVHLMILDGSLGREKCAKLARDASEDGFPVKTLILVMYREELGLDFLNAEVIMRSSGKGEFAERIKKMMTGQ